MHFENRYIGLRHGQSIPNTRGVIVSGLEEGKKSEHALSPHGEEQVRVSVARAKEERLLGADAVIYSSPFSRCRRTAEIAKEVLECEGEIIFDERLRERWFGDIEGMGIEHYQKIWEQDLRGPHEKGFDVESTAEVAERMLAVIDEIERTHTRRTILLVSHGDPLHILHTVMKGMSSAEHTSFAGPATAEVRVLA